jgi:hypothetical protein
MLLDDLKGAVAAAEAKGVTKSLVCEQAITHSVWRRRRIVGDGHAICTRMVAQLGGVGNRGMANYSTTPYSKS